jgi:hypothetical protein
MSVADVPVFITRRTQIGKNVFAATVNETVGVAPDGLSNMMHARVPAPPTKMPRDA